MKNQEKVDFLHTLFKKINKQTRFHLRMTVGLSFTNGKEAVVLIDSLASDENSHGDALGKQTLILKKNSKNFHGLIISSGNLEVIKYMNNNVLKIKSNNGEEFVKNFHEILANYVDKKLETGVSNIRKYVHINSKIYADQNKRKKYVESTLRKSKKVLSEKISSIYTHHLIVGYDALEKRIKQYSAESSEIEEKELEHNETGSGSVLANNYYNIELEGIIPNKLSLPKLAFFVLNAYHFSNITESVGGRPLISIIDNKKTNTLSLEKTKSLMNLSAAYLSNFNKTKLATNKTINYIEKIIYDKQPPYNKISFDIGLTEKQVKNMLIPYKSWKENVNSQFFIK